MAGLDVSTGKESIVKEGMLEQQVVGYDQLQVPSSLTQVQTRSGACIMTKE